MGEVWRRPSLTALEVLWRWAAGAVVLGLAVWQMLLRWRGVHIDRGALQAMTVFQPVAAFHTLDFTAQSVAMVAVPVMRWLLPLAAVLWLLVGGLGRTAVLRRFDSRLVARPISMLLLGALRMGLLVTTWLVWLRVIAAAGRIAITGPAAHGGEPNVVLYCAMVICGSLLLYALWAVFSWPLQLAPVLAMELDLDAAAALQAALRGRRVRAKLIEINLVMNIVKIALLVLAMVFSASPLPFTEVATQTFLTWWWSGVVLLYLAAMDYFHVVRSVAYLQMWRSMAGDA